MKGERTEVGRRKRQNQSSLEDQMREVIALATDHGEYDAADWIERAFFGPNKYATKLRSLSQSTPEGEG